ncbi:Ppx/GppA phosphatase [Gloeomargarita lithophora Alchichica-D10]|uniref:Ppx/GppA phosphatase n=1 Tax=Gloeomargarita lithophora Alchichica-D10 TaxID=1188229 RepID=A0A1J0AFR3_9CYAN|nr:Ppx/GppA phosphatase family protein [Gloeomargarita lithophora]APB34780.1 Ppx/GppA phosphatase [Gloeomargarita lithophora Alchichica-D10]
MTESLVLAAIDVGTNSIHMVVVRIQPQIPAFTVIAREKETVRLGERCPQTGNLIPEAMARALEALQRCLTLSQIHQAAVTIAVATSAVREAPNGTEFLQRVAAETGLIIDLIAGVEEARCIYLGVLSGMELHRQPHVVIDIGGGSTELILGDGSEPQYLSSTKVGAVRLTQEMITTDPISNAEYDWLRAYLQGMLEWPTHDLRQKLCRQTVPMIGTSGTIEALFLLHAQISGSPPPQPLQGQKLTRSQIQNLVQKLRSLNDQQRREQLHLPPKRSEIILAGAMILQETMQLLNCDQIIYCERALREGIIVNWMINHGLIADHLRYQSSVRQRSVYKLADKYRVRLEHGKQVAALALELFDQTQGELHPGNALEREYLWGAAILHNCGHFISHDAHHKHSYYLIRYGELLGYTENEIEIIAHIARYHRKSPPKRKHEAYGALDKTSRTMVERLSAFLRIAVALDRRQIGAIHHLECRLEHPDLHLYLYPQKPEDDCTLELWNLSYKKTFFESLFNLQVQSHLATRKTTKKKKISAGS